jgi:hypothetical protein
MATRTFGNGLASFRHPQEEVLRDMVAYHEGVPEPDQSETTTMAAEQLSAHCNRTHMILAQTKILVQPHRILSTFNSMRAHSLAAR